MDDDPLELFDVSQEPVLILHAVGYFAVLPFPLVLGPGFDLGHQVAHLRVVEHAPELPIKFVRLPDGHAIEAPGPSAILAILAKSVLAAVWVGGPPIFSLMPLSMTTTASLGK